MFAKLKDYFNPIPTAPRGHAIPPESQNPTGTGNVAAKAKVDARMTMRVWRAKEGVWQDAGEAHNVTVERVNDG